MERQTIFMNAYRFAHKVSHSWYTPYRGRTVDKEIIEKVNLNSRGSR